MFGLNWEAFGGPRYAEITARVTQFQTVVAFLAAGFLAICVAMVIRHKWLRPVAVLAILGFALSMDVAQWNKMRRSLSSSTFRFCRSGFHCRSLRNNLWTARLLVRRWPSDCA
jgi:uncharacterized membrane protein